MGLNTWLIFATSLFVCVFFPILIQSAPAVPGVPLPASANVKPRVLLKSNSTISNATINVPSVAIQTNGGTTAAPESFEHITSNLSGGVTTIRDAVIGLIAFLIGGAKFAVDRGVQDVADVAHRVENKTIAVKNNVKTAGGAFVNTWVDAFRQTGNITGQLVGGTLHNDPAKRPTINLS